MKSILNKLFPKPKPRWATLCSVAYTDKQGVRYYQYNDSLDMCVYRKGEIDKNILELKHGSGFNDVLKALHDVLSTPDKQGNVRPDIVKLGYLVNEITDRREMLLIPDIMFKICANMLIREDENPYLVDMEILNEKIDVFKSEIMRGGLRDFFYTAGLLKLLGLSDISTSELMRFMTNSEIQHHQKQRTTECILGKRLPSGLSNNVNTILKNY